MIPDGFSAIREGRKHFAFGDDDYVFKILVGRAVGTTLLANRAGGESDGCLGVLVSPCDRRIIKALSRYSEPGDDYESDYEEPFENHVLSPLKMAKLPCSRHF